jgi:hypothetical protein
MRYRVQALKPLLWFVAVSLIGVQASGAHVHVCLDGHEPLTSLRVADGSLCEGEHDGSAADKTGTPHQDQDVDALGSVLVKKNAADDHVFTLAAAYVLSIVLPRTETRFAPTKSDPPRSDDPSFLLPPLRGPPA